MLVRIIKDWSFPDIFRQTPGNSKVWDGIFFTEDKVQEADLIVVLNATNSPLFIKCKEAWLLSQESPIEFYAWHKRVFPYFDKVFSFWEDPDILHDQTCLPWHINRTYDQLKQITKTDLTEKRDELSWVTSNYTNKPGHLLRMKFLEFLRENNYPFDLYGKGFAPIDDKFDGIFPYKYSLAVENYSCNDYWTEKIADCFLSWTMPVYFGCKNILKYFPEGSMILIDPNDPQSALKTIRTAMEENRWERNIDAIAEARELILDKYQFFPSIAVKIRQHLIDTKPLRWHYIPQNTIEDFPAHSQLIFNTFKAKLKNIYD